MSKNKQTPFQIDANTRLCIERLLSFLNSLDNTKDNQQNSDVFNEKTLIDLFSVDNHLLSTIYVPTDIQQLSIIPKSIRQSLKNSSDDEQILSQVKQLFIYKYQMYFVFLLLQQIQLLNNRQELNSKMYKKSKTVLSMTKEKFFSNDNTQMLNLIEKDHELVSLNYRTF